MSLRYNLAAVKQDAAHHWPAIISRVAGIGDDYLSTAHGPCPKCGGNDRWRVFDDFDETGGAICNQCGKFGDGLAVVMWYLGIGFPQAVQKIAEFLGTSPEGSGKAARGKGNGGANQINGYPVPAAPKLNGVSSASHKPNSESPKLSGNSQAPSPGSDPPEFRTLEILPPIPTDDIGFAMWCAKKPGMTVAGIKAVGGRFARYRGRYSVIAFPVVDSTGRQTGWTIYERDGGMLPHFVKGSKEVAQWLKVKTIKGK